jgi:hypothetical protein
VGEHIGFTRFLIILLLLLLLSARFLSVNVLRNYWTDQFETFQDDSLAFVDVRNEGHFAIKCVHARARAFEFFKIKTCKTNYYWRDQFETFQDDSLASVDVRNEGHCARKCMHTRARAFEFFNIKRAKLTFLFFVQIHSNLYGR